MKTIWRLELDDYTLETLTQHDIMAAENYFSCKLPLDYINLLKTRNGGSLMYNALPATFTNSWADDHIPITFLYGIKQGEGIFQSRYLLTEWGISEDKFIIISGDGHYWIVLDYRSSEEEPKITFIDTEQGFSTVIFNSFKDMLESLYVHEHEDFDFAQYDDEVSLENAKKLIRSEEKEEILHGILLWVGTMEEIEELITTLFHFIDNNKDADIIYTSFEQLTNIVINDFIEDELAKRTASKLLEEITIQNNSDLEPYKYLLNQYLS